MYDPCYQIKFIPDVLDIEYLNLERENPSVSQIRSRWVYVVVICVCNVADISV